MAQGYKCWTVREYQNHNCSNGLLDLLITQPRGIEQIRISTECIQCYYRAKFISSVQLLLSLTSFCLLYILSSRNLEFKEVTVGLNNLEKSIVLMPANKFHQHYRYHYNFTAIKRINLFHLQIYYEKFRIKREKNCHYSFNIKMTARKIHEMIQRKLSTKVNSFTFKGLKKCNFNQSTTTPLFNPAKLNLLTKSRL